MPHSHPKGQDIETGKKILVRGVYILPHSQHKQDNIEHIIQTMFLVQSQHEFQVHYFVSSDFYQVNIENVLESNGALHQVCPVPTTKSSILELVITDMATMFYQPTTPDRFNQDKNSKGKPSDHNVIIVAPRTKISFKKERHKKRIHLRPQP